MSYSLYSVIHNKVIDVENPKPHQFSLKNISTALANNSCFNGQTERQFYALAQRAIIVSENVPKNLQKYGLLKDTAKAMLGSISPYLKEKCPHYLVVEEKIMRAVSNRFQLDYKMFQDPLLIHIYNQCRNTEAKEFMLFINDDSEGYLSLKNINGNEYYLATMIPFIVRRAWISRFTHIQNKK